MKKIKIKAKNKGLLHEKLGLSVGTKIPDYLLEKAKKSSSPSLRKEATFAKNARGWSKK